MKRLALLFLVTVTCLCGCGYAAAQETTELQSVPMGIDYALGSTDIRQPFTVAPTSLEFFFTLEDGYATSTKDFTFIQINNASGDFASMGFTSVEYDDNAWKYKCIIGQFSRISYPGTFTLTIPEGTFFNSTYQNEETVISFTQIVPYKASTFTPNNKQSIELTDEDNLNSIAILFPTNPSRVEDGPMPYFLMPDGSKDFATSFEGSGRYMYAKFADTENYATGNYTLVIPAGSCVIPGGYLNEEQTYVYDVRAKKVELGEQDYTLTSARLIQDGETYNLMEAGNAFKKIAIDADLFFTLANCQAEEVWFKIADVTDCPEGDLAAYNNAEAVYTNFATLTGTEYYKSIYAISVGYTLYEDHKYVLLIQDNAFNPVSASAIFEGLTPTYKYSNVDVLSITPEPGSIFTIEDTMTIKFSAPVVVANSNGATGFSKGTSGWALMTSISHNEDMTEYTFTFPEAAFLGVSGENCIDVVICAAAQSGGYFHPASMGEWEPECTEYWIGDGAQTRLHILYSSYYDTKEVTVSPTEAQTIDELTFAPAEDELTIGPSWMANTANILDKNNEIVSQVILEGFVDNGGNITPVGPASGYTAMKVKLSEPLTVKGEYTLEMPYNMFTIGKELDARASSAAQVKLTISDPSEVSEIETDGDATYYNLQGIKVANPEKGVYLKVTNGKAVKVRF